MNERDEEFLKRLRETFRVEAAEHLQRISDGLIELERGPDAEVRAGVVEAVLREAHSLKGAARAVSHADVEAVCQLLESAFAALKRGETGLSGPLLETFYDAVDVLGDLLAASGEELGAGLRSKGAAVIRALTDAVRGIPVAPRPAPLRPALPVSAVRTDVVEAGPASQGDATLSDGPETEPRVASEAVERPARVETVRVAAAKLDALLLQAEEMLAVKLTSARLADQLRALGGSLAEWERQWARARDEMRRARRPPKPGRPPARARASGECMAGFLEWNQGFVRALQSRLSALTLTADQDRRATAAMVDGLLEGAKRALMMPFGVLLEAFPKIVRDVARSRGKEAELVIEGGEIEIDRRVLEAMKDPLLHLVRNAADHGLESRPERERRGKPARGTITISAAQRGSNRIEIAVADDGAGIDVDAVREQAVAAGLISRAAAARLSEREALAFIFHSGLSTSPVVTDISGRGLGLAILCERVERLGGAVSVETERHTGTCFRILLPLTLATFRGVLVEAGGRPFVLPTMGIERVMRVRRAEIRTVGGRETILVDGQAIVLVRLDQVLEMAERGEDKKPFVLVVVLNVAGRRAAFAVDAVLNEQEVIVKSLGTQLARVRNVAGATVLDAGQVVPILNASDVIKSATRLSDGPVVGIAAETTARGNLSLLVADDSITSRTLLKNVLEGAGYRVQTAVDGLEAWALLKTEAFDLVVTDVEMPRLNGFELTVRIRADEQLRDLPVVLVTALASAEDRARGVDAGANAYIIKSSFDQSNLLEVVRRLI